MAGCVFEGLAIDIIAVIEDKNGLIALIQAFSGFFLEIFCPMYCIIRVPFLISCAANSPLPAIRDVPTQTRILMTPLSLFPDTALAPYQETALIPARLSSPPVQAISSVSSASSWLRWRSFLPLKGPEDFWKRWRSVLTMPVTCCNICRNILAPSPYRVRHPFPWTRTRGLLDTSCSAALPASEHTLRLRLRHPAQFFFQFSGGLERLFSDTHTICTMRRSRNLRNPSRTMLPSSLSQRFLLRLRSPRRPLSATQNNRSSPQAPIFSTP